LSEVREVIQELLFILSPVNGKNLKLNRSACINAHRFYGEERYFKQLWLGCNQLLELEFLPSPKMTVFEARQILGLQSPPVSSSASRDLVEKRADQLFHANDPRRGGSYYVQQKIAVARHILLEDIHMLHPTSTNGSSGSSSGASTQKPRKAKDVGKMNC